MASPSEILLQQGRLAAESALQRGAISARMWSDLGQIGAGAVNAYQQDVNDRPRRELQAMQLQGAKDEQAAATAEREREARLSALFQSGQRPTVEQVSAIMGPERGAKIVGALDALDAAATKRFGDKSEVIAKTLAGLDATPENLRASVYPGIRTTLINAGVITPQDAPEAYDPTWFQQARNFGAAAPKPQEGFTLSPGQTRFGPDGKPIAEVAPTPEKPEKVTFGPMKRVVLSDGKTLTIRERSDGSIVDMKGQVIEDQGVDLYEKPTGGGQPRALTPNAESQLIGRLANQWTTATKPARELDRQVNIMDEGMKAVERGDLAQGGQAVLVTFQKILDPTSVVRESEFDRSREGLSLMQRATAAMERLSKGGAGVPLDELKKYAALAREIANKQRDSRLSAIKERLGKNADRYNIPRELVFEDELPGGSTEAVTVTPKNIVTTPPPDNSGTWKWDGSKWVKK